MSRTLFAAGRIPPRAHRLECYECGGDRVVMVVAGHYRTAHNVVVPREEYRPCEECEGAGLNPCCYCGSRSTEYICNDGPVCGPCRKGIE